MHLLLADIPPAPQPTDTGIEQTIIMIVVAFFFFYFMIMRPENKRRKELETKRQGVKKGDRVIIAGGIIGEVFRIQQDSIILKLHDGAKMEVLKIAIQDIQPTSSVAVAEAVEEACCNSKK